MCPPIAIITLFEPAGAPMPALSIVAIMLATSVGNQALVNVDALACTWYRNQHLHFCFHNYEHNQRNHHEQQWLSPLSGEATKPGPHKHSLHFEHILNLFVGDMIIIIMTWWQSNDDDDVEDLDPGVFLQIWAQPPFSSKHSSTSSHFELSTSLEFFQWELFWCLWMENYMDWLRIDLNPLLQAQWWPPGWFIHSCSHPPFAWSSSWFKSIGMMIMGWLLINFQPKNLLTLVLVKAGRFILRTDQVARIAPGHWSETFFIVIMVMMMTSDNGSWWWVEEIGRNMEEPFPSSPSRFNLRRAWINRWWLTIW